MAAPDAGTDPDTDVSDEVVVADEAAAGEPLPNVPAGPSPLPGRTEQALLPELDADGVAEMAARTGVPLRALAAYAGAALRIADEDPGCGLTWVTIAGVGWVESHHGSIGGGPVGRRDLRLQPLGRVRPQRPRRGRQLRHTRQRRLTSAAVGRPLADGR